MLKIKTFEPNSKEMEDMKSLLEKIINDPECQNTGMAKVGIFYLYLRDVSTKIHSLSMHTFSKKFLSNVHENNGKKQFISNNPLEVRYNLFSNFLDLIPLNRL